MRARSERDPSAFGRRLRSVVAGRPAACALGEGCSAPADPHALMRVLPPLVKGYFRLAATFSPLPAVDPAFKTTDLFVVMPLSDVEERYLHYFGVELAPAALAA
jgi:hypothetical protein